MWAQTPKAGCFPQYFPRLDISRILKVFSFQRAFVSYKRNKIKMNIKKELGEKINHIYIVKWTGERHWSCYFRLERKEELPVLLN